MPPSRSFPPLDRCCGTRPSHAANWRPDLNCRGSPTVAMMALAVIGPMPGTVRSDTNDPAIMRDMVEVRGIMDRDGDHEKQPQQRMLTYPRLSAEPVLAHSQGDNHAILGPVKGDHSAQLSCHAPLHHLAAEPVDPRGSHDSGAAPLGPLRRLRPREHCKTHLTCHSGPKERRI